MTHVPDGQRCDLSDSPGPLPANAAPPGCPHCGQAWSPEIPIKPGWSAPKNTDNEREA